MPSRRAANLGVRLGASCEGTKLTYCSQFSEGVEIPRCATVSNLVLKIPIPVFIPSTRIGRGRLSAAPSSIKKFAKENVRGGEGGDDSYQGFEGVYVCAVHVRVEALLW